MTAAADDNASQPHRRHRDVDDKGTNGKGVATMSTASRTPARLAIGTAIATLPIALTLSACSGSSPAPAAVASTPPASAAQAAATTAAGNTAPVATGSVKVPKYVAVDNARKDIVTTGCSEDGAHGWRLTGTATNKASSAQTYSIVVDFVTPKGDTVVDTKVLHVGPVRPAATKHWSTMGAAGQSQIVCVIRQAMAQS
jgi:hypothetical protein